MNMTFTAYSTAGVILIIARTFTRKDRSTHALVALGLLLGTCFSIPFVIELTGGMTNTLDTSLLFLDHCFGLDSMTLARFVYSSKAMRDIVTVTYCSLPLVIAIVYTAELDISMIASVILSGLLASVCFLLVPATGPAHAFEGFPWTSPKLSLSYSTVMNHYPRNAFPSMHFGWALILFIHIRNKYLKLGLAIFCFLTALATVGSGEHYFVDLVASVPLVILTEKITESIPGLIRERRKDVPGNVF